MIASGSPLSPPQLDEFVDRGFDGLQNSSALLLAVSGGPDSIALMHLAARWAGRRARPPALHVATVDHGLRAEAAAEAAMVAAAAADLGLPHAVLAWTEPKPPSRLQERARAARYDLLAEHARKLGASHILTAHHADDHAETVLFRLGRGSGIGGLAGMRRVTLLAQGVSLARPLLELTKQDLVAFCREHSVRYVDDPSNRDPRFARARLRENAAMLAKLGLDTAGLVRLARRLTRANDALEAETTRLEQALQPSRSPAAFSIYLRPARDASPEIAMRLVGRAVAHVAENERVTRLERLEALTEILWAALLAEAPHRATLAGTRVTLDAAGHLDVVREPPRRRGMTKRKGSADRPY